MDRMIANSAGGDMEKKNLYQKIVEMRKEFVSERLNKSGVNPFAKYSYFELGDFIPKAMVLCEKYGVLPIISFDNGLAVMRVFDTESDQAISITSPMADASMKGCTAIQAIGAAETYSRRYLWMALLEIVESDGLEAVTGSDEPQKQQPTAQARTTAPSEAPKKDTRPAGTFNGMDVWKQVLEFFGYDFGKDKSDKDNADAMAAAHELFDPYAKTPKELTESKGKAILERLQNMKAAVPPEDFQDDSDLLEQGA